MNYRNLSAVEIADGIRKGSFSAVEICRAALDAAEKSDNLLNIFLHLDPEGALRSAADVDRKRQKDKETGCLAGVPVVIKDNICAEGLPNTCGSKILEGWIPPYDATVVRRIKAAGMVILGKSNLDEFAMGSSTENSAYEPTRNPWAPERVPGGSSGGSAAAVASGVAPLALGSDTGGSIRQPAGFCGLVGLKPTYGRVSRYGLVAFASSLDQIGPLARTARDAGRFLGVFAGDDPADATCGRESVPEYERHLSGGFKGLRIGIPREFLTVEMDDEVRECFERTVGSAEENGASVQEISLPHVDYSLPAYYLIAPSECSSNLARYDGVKFGTRIGEGGNLENMYLETRAAGFGREVKRRILIGTYALKSGYYDEYYLKACKVRTLVRQDFRKAFEGVDLLMAPVSPVPAFRLGEKIDDPLQMYFADIFTLCLNLAGNPGISIPCGFTRASLPVGVQFFGNDYEEGLLLRVAAAMEQATGLKNLVAPMPGNLKPAR